MFIMGF